MLFLQLLIDRLGGMEMAYEFFKLHQEVERRAVDVAEKRSLGLSVDPDSDELFANYFFNEHFQPLIESDRIAAQTAERKW